MVIAFTGHRPERLGGEPGSSRMARQAVALLAQAIDRALARDPQTLFLSGGARGADQWAAALVLDRGARLTIARPFPTQDARWPTSARSAYAALLARCAAAGGAIVDISPAPFVGAYTRHDRWMVDGADAVVAVWDGGPGGTGRCVAYARRLRRPILRIVPGEGTMAWERWEPPDELMQPRLFLD